MRSLSALVSSSQAGVLFEQFQQLRGVLRRLCLSLTVGGRQRFTMLGIGIGLRLIPRRLTSLCQQNQRCGIRRLQAERQVEQDEGIDIEVGHTGDVEGDPHRDDQCLCTEKSRRAKEPRKGLGTQSELVIAKGRRQVGVRAMEAQVIDGGGSLVVLLFMLISGGGWDLGSL